MRIKLLIPPPVYALMMGGLMWFLNHHFPINHFIAMPWNWIGVVLILISGAFDIWSILLFFKKHTTANPMKPENTTDLVTKGLYKITRNPMYVGLLVILTGYAIWLGSVTPFLVLPIFYFLITEMQIKPEEAILEEKFGQEYLNYKKRVRRWL
ncbi:MAG: isoprenylcysteine carboxylmethyltransferase family protein [Sulfurovum sp.]|nr:MAG: isoprenylcysteine carboxylmethyltransferase family protein [Sulfurovum sp.]